MQIDKEAISTDSEKLILTGLIVSDKFCKLISQIINVDLLKLNYSKIIAKWCLNYYQEYKKAPHKDIQNLYNSWLADPHNEEDENIIVSFLDHLSKNYEREKSYNEQYAIDQSVKYLKQRKINQLKESIEDAQKNNNEEEAEKLILEFKKVQLPIDKCVDVFKDEKIVNDVLYSEEEGIFRFNGVLGDYIGELLRGDLVSFAAPAKRGKSFMLIECALRAVMLGLRVIFFSLEMPKKQILRRVYQNLLGESRREKEVSLPQFIKREDGLYEIESKNIQKYGLKSSTVRSKLKNMRMMIKNASLKMFFSSPHKLSVSEIESISDNLVNNEGFVPDVIIIDYLDITKSESKFDFRHKINDRWENARSLAIEKDCLVITATHTNKTTFDKDMKQKDMSEDIRKINHVSLMLGMNQTMEEKKYGIARINTLVNRQEYFNLREEICVLQNLSIGKPLLDSKLKKDVKYNF